MKAAVLACVALIPLVALAGDKPKSTDKPRKTLSRQELEKKFADSLNGVTMVGHYTVAGGGGKEQPELKAERYEIAKVSKVKGDVWLFDTGIHFGEHDVKLPLPLEVKWAGDTPVITLNDVNVPGLGTFSARVVIHDGQYAGTWSGGDHGGHLFGTLEKDAGEKPGADAAPDNAAEAPDADADK